MKAHPETVDTVPSVMMKLTAVLVMSQNGMGPDDYAEFARECARMFESEAKAIRGVALRMSEQMAKGGRS
jgi:hypothetical protein